LISQIKSLRVCGGIFAFTTLPRINFACRQLSKSVSIDERSVPRRLTSVCIIADERRGIITSLRIFSQLTYLPGPNLTPSALLREASDCLAVASFLAAFAASDCL